jgi:hypothetical protein
MAKKPKNEAGAMRRPRKTTSAELAPVGDNDLSDDQKRGLFLNGVTKLERLVADVGSAVAAVRDQRKKMKADGYNKTEVDYALWLRKKKEPEAIEEAQARARVARWLAHPVGHQMSIFDEAEPDRTPLVDRAREEGKVAAFENKACKPPYDAATEAGQAWIAGHHEGQEVIAKGFKPLPKADGEDDLRPRFKQGDGMPGAPASH